MEITQSIDIWGLAETANTALGFGICSFIAVLCLLGGLFIYAIEKKNSHD